jgi:hypothetical protein
LEGRAVYPWFQHCQPLDDNHVSLAVVPRFDSLQKAAAKVPSMRDLTPMLHCKKSIAAQTPEHRRRVVR